MEYKDYLFEVASYSSNGANLPASIYENGILIKRFEFTKFPNQYLDYIYKELKEDKNEEISYKVYDKLMFGLIKKTKGNFECLLGPFKIMEITDSDLREMFFKYNIDKEYLTDIKNFSRVVPKLSFQYAIQMLSFFYLVINNKKIPTTAIVLKDEDKDINEYYNDKEKDKSINSNDSSEVNTTLDFENVMLSYIQDGKADQLLSFFESATPGNYGQIAYNVLRQEKNYAICSIALSSRAAIKGGLDSSTAFEISDYAIQRIETCNYISEINKISFSTIMELTNRVAESRKIDNVSPLVQKTVNYINKHLIEKITVNELAEKLNVNRTFLSNKFSKEMNITINEYINQEKIKEAKRLLKYMDKSLVDISNYLSFSSQSHFNKAFKDATNMTPLEYRNKKRKSD